MTEEAEHIETAEEFEIRRLNARIAELERELSKHQESEFHPDWSMLEATRDVLKEYQGEVDRLRAAIISHGCGYEASGGEDTDGDCGHGYEWDCDHCPIVEEREEALAQTKDGEA